MLGVLVKVFGFNGIAARSGFSGQRHVPFMVLVVRRAGCALTAVLRARLACETPACPSWPILHCYFRAPLRHAALDLQS
jgi:hypothetical protein